MFYTINTVLFDISLPYTIVVVFTRLHLRFEQDRFYLGYHYTTISIEVLG